MRDFDDAGRPERLFPWSQVGYVLMLGLALAMIAGKSDMNPKLRAILRNTPVIGSFVRPVGEQPDGEGAAPPAARSERDVKKAYRSV